MGNNPPKIKPVLVKTWIDILRYDQAPEEAKDRAIEMIEKHFGTVVKAMAFLEEQAEPV